MPAATDIRNRTVFSYSAILQHLDKQDLSMRDLARFLNLTPGSVSRGLQRQSWLAKNMDAIAAFLHSDKAVFVESEMPDAAPGKNVIEHVLGDATANEIAMPRHGVFRKLQKTPGAEWVWYALSGPEAKPRLNDLVTVTTDDGRTFVRPFASPADDKDTVVLLPMRQNDPPVVLARDRIKDMRILLFPVTIKHS